jgi:transposase-like protein
MYLKYPLSLRNVEDLLSERRIDMDLPWESGELF